MTPWIYNPHISVAILQKGLIIWQGYMASERAEVGRSRQLIVCPAKLSFLTYGVWAVPLFHSRASAGQGRPDGMLQSPRNGAAGDSGSADQYGDWSGQTDPPPLRPNINTPSQSSTTWPVAWHDIGNEKVIVGGMRTVGQYVRTPGHTNIIH